MVEDKHHPHLLIRGAARTENYIYPGSGGSRVQLPPRDRAVHSRHLLRSLEEARKQADFRKQEARAWGVPAKKGIVLEFESEPGYELELGGLDSRRAGNIQLLNVRKVRKQPGGPETILATVLVPKGKLSNLENKLQAYATKQTKTGRPRNQKLAENISQIRLAHLRAFWTDLPELLPKPEVAIWWEIWLRSSEEVLFQEFTEAVAPLEIDVAEESLEFPGTRVALAHGTLEQFSRSIEVVDAIAELRRAKEATSFFLELPQTEETEWVRDLVKRTNAPRPNSPRVCILDAGVNAGHPLLQIASDSSTLHTVDTRWGTDDNTGHGTGMAGLALYGDLTPLLAGSSTVDLYAWLESVKILSPKGDNDPRLYGRITEQAVYGVEIDEPHARRTIAMAVSTIDGRDQGRPSSWSAALDKLSFASENEPKRLVVLAAGNSDPGVRVNHPDHLDTEEIHDPGQSWNALTVGSYTTQWKITESDLAGWTPIAQPGDLSPCTTTSMVWKSEWPMKPDLWPKAGTRPARPAVSASGRTRSAC